MILTWTINNLILDGLMSDSDLSPTSWDFLSPPSALPVPVWRQPDVQQTCKSAGFVVVVVVVAVVVVVRLFVFVCLLLLFSYMLFALFTNLRLTLAPPPPLPQPHMTSTPPLT